MRELTEQEIELVDNNRFGIVGLNRPSRMMANQQTLRHGQRSTRNE